MKIDDDKDLLAKEGSILGKATHPIPFPPYQSVSVNKNNFIQVILDCVKDYQTRTFIISSDNYGITVSVNYDEGKFQSMILKGSGEEGECINKEIALLLVPEEAKNKKKMTLHAQLTIIDRQEFRGGMEKHEVPLVLKQALMLGMSPREGKKIVCRPYAFFIDGVRQEMDLLWGDIGDFILSGLYFTAEYDELEKRIREDFEFGRWIVPQRGIIIKDESPDEENAFPETHFLMDDE